MSELVKTKIDMVNKPPHYQLFEGIEVKDVREKLMDMIEPDVDYNNIDDWSRSWEYLTRMWQKGGVEDAKKARWYLNRMIARME